MARGKPLRKSNPERIAKRRKAYKARLARADWKALRLARFALDGFQCTATVWVPNNAYELGVSLITERCPNGDETFTGKGLICDHLTYARFGHESLDDLRTLCRSCNARLTKSERANWMTP